MTTFCPICDNRLSRNSLNVEFCRHCGSFAKSSSHCCYLFWEKKASARWFLSEDVERHQVETELRVLVRHSEWSRWRDSEQLFLDRFHQSLFADWCADNNFPLQEAAVRKKLEAV